MTVRYLPNQLSEDLRRWAPPEVSSSELYELERLAERIYAQGYDDGHARGYREGWDAEKRPNINDVNQLREALAAKQDEAKAGAA